MKINKITTVLLALTWVGAVGGFASDVTGDRLKIGVSGGANQAISASGASIAGGNNNTNLSANSTIAGGELNQILSDSGWSFIGGGYSNFISDDVSSSLIVGGTYNKILDDSYVSLIGGGTRNSISNNSPYSVILGGAENVIGRSSSYAGILSGEGSIIHEHADYTTIGGGAANEVFSNSFFGSFSTIGGGIGNVVQENAPYSTIAGGNYTKICSGASGSTIAGGAVNKIGTNSVGGVISGGGTHTIDNNAAYGTIAGGEHNYVGPGANYGTVGGGSWNQALGDHSFAAGFDAVAAHEGCFVWGDHAADHYVYSSSSNQFVVRATGGVWFGTNNGTISIPNGHYIETSTGGYLSAGGAWTDSSDRNAKRGFAPVNAREILRKVVELPISSWSYRAEDVTTRHVGPMAQDFFAAFQVGPDDRHIASVDEGGVALSAIQGLSQVVKEKDSQISDLEIAVSILKSQLASQRASEAQWETRLGALEKSVARSEQAAGAPTFSEIGNR